MQFQLPHKIFQISLVFAIGLLFVLPQLNSIHYDPIPEFWSEITFVWVSVIIIVLSLFIKNIMVPEISIWLTAIAIMFVVQPIFVPINFPDFNHLVALEMLLGAVLSISFNSIKGYLTRNNLFSTIMLAIVVGCVLQSIIGFAQYTGMYRHLESVFFYDPSHPTTNIFGNFGQRNHYCQYLTWGVFGLIYLAIQKRISTIVFATLLSWFAFSMTIGASRSVILYIVMAVLIAICNVIFSKDKKLARTIFVYISISAISIISMELLFPYLIKILSHNNTHHIASGLERITENSSNQGGRRIVEWSKAWHSFTLNPIFGNGWNQFGSTSFKLHYLYPNAEANSGLFVNCHNLILQLLSDVGIIGTLLILSAIIRMVYLIIKSYYLDDNLICIITLCIISAIMIHSLNEYPLWYIYFLMPFIIFLGYNDSGIQINLPQNMYKYIMIAPIAYVIYQIIINSIIFNNFVGYTDVPDEDDSYVEQVEYLKSYRKDPLWAYQAYYTLDNYVSISNELTDSEFNIKEQMAQTKAIFNETPFLETSIKLAKLEYLYGDKRIAKSLIESCYLYYPTYTATFNNSLKNIPTLAKIVSKKHTNIQK